MEEIIEQTWGKKTFERTPLQPNNPKVVMVG